MSMEQISFEIVRPCEEHGRLVMEWRNDPETLRCSFDPRPKVWSAFFDEFCNTYFSTPGLSPLFALHQGKRVAFLRFRQVFDPDRPSRRGVDVSLNVAPSYRCRGVAVAALQQVSEIALNGGYDDLIAEIKVDNTASQQVFEKAGYTFIEETMKEGCWIRRYLKRLMPLNPGSKGIFIVAEAGSNWRMGTQKRDIAMAKALVDVAVDAGADAVKFQTYRPDSIYVQNAGFSHYLTRMGIQEDIRSVLADLSMSYQMIPEIADHCKKQGIVFMSTPFSTADFEAVDPFVSVHKIASYEISHLRLIELAARSGKPLLLSTGASCEQDVAWAVETFRKNGGESLTLLQCTAKYPAKPNSLNLRALRAMKKRFHVSIGLSDHSRDPVLAPVGAVTLGATVIEKHFTLSNGLPGPDHVFAVTPVELKKMVKAIRKAESMLGTGIKEVHCDESELYHYARRGVQAVCNIGKGDLLEEGVNVEILRPGQQVLGVHPKFLEEMQGRPALRAIEEGAGIQEEDW